MKDWASYKSGWYKIKIKLDTDEKFREILDWISQNIQGHRKHTIWKINEHRILEIRFRYEKDYAWFVLRWS